MICKRPALAPAFSFREFSKTKAGAGSMWGRFRRAEKRVEIKGWRSKNSPNASGFPDLLTRHHDTAARGFIHG
jgi:hypothetical protein